MKKSQNTIRTNTTAYKTLHFITGKIIPPVIAIAVFITFWQYLSGSELMPSFMMPSPAKVIKAFINDWPVLLEHAATTLSEAFIGLSIGIVLSFIVSILMDACRPLYNALYPVIVVTQTIPSIAIAPLLTLWLGYGITPKIVLVVITTFFLSRWDFWMVSKLLTLMRLSFSNRWAPVP